MGGGTLSDKCDSCEGMCCEAAERRGWNPAEGRAPAHRSTEVVQQLQEPSDRRTRVTSDPPPHHISDENQVTSSWERSPGTLSWFPKTATAAAKGSLFRWGARPLTFCGRSIRGAQLEPSPGAAPELFNLELRLHHGFQFQFMAPFYQRASY